MASDSGFGESLDSLFKETLDSLFGVDSDNGFGVASDSGFGVASDSGFGVALETDSYMGELFTNNLCSTGIPEDQLIFETDILLDSTPDSSLVQYVMSAPKSIQIQQDQNSKNSNTPSVELEEFDPDTNLYLFLNNQSEPANLDLTAYQEQTLEDQFITIQDTSGGISPIFMVENSINEVGMNEPFGSIDYMDQALLSLGESDDSMEMTTNQMTSKKGSDNRHRKGPKPLSKEDIKDDDKWRNVKRCRDYRKNKTKKITVEKTELEILEAENSDLRMEEDQLKAKVTKMKNLYIKLISDGRIKFG